MSEYRSQLQGWLSDTQRDFGSYAPRDSSLHFANSNASDDAMYLMATMLYREIRYNMGNPGNKKDSESEWFYLVPYKGPNGYFVWDRLNQRTIASMDRMPNGLYSFYGPRKYMTMHGGRGELGFILNELKDDDLYHDTQPKREK